MGTSIVENQWKLKMEIDGNPRNSNDTQYKSMTINKNSLKSVQINKSQ